MRIEQMQGEPEVRSDLYALGATMHHLLSGKPPVPFNFPAIRSLRSEVSADMEALLEKALKLHAHERYGTAREIKAALEGIGCLKPGEKSKSLYSHQQKATTTIKNSCQNIYDKNIGSKPLNLSLVIDISKSMYLDQKIMFVIAAINDIVDILMPEDFFQSLPLPINAVSLFHQPIFWIKKRRRIQLQILLLMKSTWVLQEIC